MSLVILNLVVVLLLGASLYGGAWLTAKLLETSKLAKMSQHPILYIGGRTAGGFIVGYLVISGTVLLALTLGGEPTFSSTLPAQSDTRLGGADPQTEHRLDSAPISFGAAAKWALLAPTRTMGQSFPHLTRGADAGPAALSTVMKDGTAGPPPAALLLKVAGLQAARRLPLFTAVLAFVLLVLTRRRRRKAEMQL